MRHFLTPLSSFKRISPLRVAPSLLHRPSYESQSFDWRRYGMGALVVASLCGAKMAFDNKNNEMSSISSLSQPLSPSFGRL